MKNSRKQLIQQIAIAEKKLKHQQLEIEKHREYLLHLFDVKKLIAMATLLPSFIMGWESARIGQGDRVFKRLIKFGFFTTLAHFRKTFIKFL